MHAQAQVAQNLDALQGVNVRVQVVHLDVDLAQIVGQVLGHALGQRGDEHALAPRRAQANLPDQVINLALGWPHNHLRVHQAGGADNLFDDLARMAALVRARRGAGVNDLVDQRLELLESQWAVVQRAGQAEAILNEHFLAVAVAPVHA